MVRHIVTALGAGLAGAAISRRCGRHRRRVPGAVERTRKEGVRVHAPSWGWRAVPLRAMLAERIDRPIALGNGAKAMAQAELWLGAGRRPGWCSLFG